MIKHLLILSVIFFLTLPTGFAMAKYGDAEIKKGELIIVRDGLSRSYDTTSGRVEVLENDVLRVGKSSLVLLNSIEKTRMQMGSNAIFQVKSWRQKQQSGLLRMLYGKMIFHTKKLIKKKRRFRLRTATATIGVKGTTCQPEVASNGMTSAGCSEGIGEIAGADGIVRELPPGMMSFVARFSATPPVVNPKMQLPLSERQARLGKVGANGAGNGDLSNEGFAKRLGVLSEEDLRKGKDTHPTKDTEFYLRLKKKSDSDDYEKDYINLDEIANKIQEALQNAIRRKGQLAPDFSDPN